MGGMSIWHLLIIAFILLMVFGPNRLSEMGSSLGKGIRNFKKGLDGSDEIDVTNTTRKEQLNAGQANQQIPTSQGQTPGAEEAGTPTPNKNKQS